MHNLSKLEKSNEFLKLVRELGVEDSLGLLVFEAVYNDFDLEKLANLLKTKYFFISATKDFLDNKKFK